MNIDETSASVDLLKAIKRIHAVEAQRTRIFTMLGTHQGSVLTRDFIDAIHFEALSAEEESNKKWDSQLEK